MAQQLRLGVLASHEGTTAQALIDAVDRGNLDAVVAVVISNNSRSRVMERARRAGIHTRHLSGITHPDPVELDHTMSDTLSACAVDLVVLAGYMKKLGPATIATYPSRIINTHAALLPKFGGQGMHGIHVHEAVLAAGEPVTGATVHHVDGQYDHGAVIAQRKVSVGDDDTPQSLQARVLFVEHELLVQVIAGWR
jgi:phosphoribosylglycinamide formyltransferase-1